jgi:feruloyl esterase
MNFRWCATLLVGAAAVLGHVGGAAAQSCEDLKKLSLPGASVTGVESVAAGALTAGAVPKGTEKAVQAALAKLPALCRVMISAKPGPGSDIRIEVWLPAAGWNGRLQAVGDGGLAGFIPFALMAQAMAGGYATAGTDTGHVGANVDFMPGNPDKLLDFAYRSTHELAKAAKAVIAAHYGKPPRWSYYNACSGGGRHGITSAQRFPDDFDGIVAGAPSWNQARLDAARIGINLTVNRTPEHHIPAAKYPMVHRAVMQACDGLDGVVDGIIENPRECRFDYAALLCKGADDGNCLTAAQVESAKTLTSPFRDSVSGRLLLEPHLRPGSELQWATMASPKPLPNSLARVRHLHLKDTSHEFRLENIAEDVERAARMDAGLLASDNYNLKPFFDRGGKLIMWHGWSDPQVPAEGSIIYYENVRKTVGAAADGSLSLYMLPGVLHCRGGPGADSFDRMAAITAWVERGERPARLVASRLAAGKVVSTRTICPFPQTARYSGSGDPADAANFTCSGAATAQR